MCVVIGQLQSCDLTAVCSLDSRECSFSYRDLVVFTHFCVFIVFVCIMCLLFFLLSFGQ